MHSKKNHISVFEHNTLKLGQIINQVEFDAKKLQDFQKYYGEKGVPYFSLVHNGIKFNEYVGVIQIGNTVIEVLPKVDNSDKKNDKTNWRNFLIDMVYASGVFKIHAPSSSNLKLKPNTILDLYFELFINEVEYLLHTGLVKQYRKKEANVTALKGSLQFNKHLQQNIIHQERFFVRHTTYDVEHTLHFILYKTIQVLKHLNTNAALQSRIGVLLLHFPEMPNIKIIEATFDKLVYSRKTQSYKSAIDIAKLILLHYHPDVNKGKNDVLALMFDMNKLWEKFVYKSLLKHKSPDATITAQSSKYFWQPDKGNRSSIRPDIIFKNKDICIVLDTKWKNLSGYNPSPEDLRQMYVYHEYYAAHKVALVYPGAEYSTNSGKYFSPKGIKLNDKECSVITVAIPNKEGNNSIVKLLQFKIHEKFEDWINLNFLPTTLS